jgi:hypothetical protein
MCHRMDRPIRPRRRRERPPVEEEPPDAGAWADDDDVVGHWTDLAPMIEVQAPSKDDSEIGR